MGHLYLIFDFIKSSLRMYGLWRKTTKGMFEYRTTNGTIFHLRKNAWDSGIIMESWWLKSYTRHLRSVQSNAIIIDIGAHIGIFSLFAATQYAKSHVYAFEPAPQNFALLNKNIKTNNLAKRITSFNIAITDGKRKSITLNLHPSNLGMHSVVFDYGLGERGQKHEVKTISLEKIFYENKIKKCQILKLDCEGAEYEILFSAPKKILEKIKNIVMEYSDDNQVDKLRKFLENAGFKTKSYQTLQIPLPNAVKKLYRLKIGKAPMLLASRENLD